ncbi:MAG: glycosyltransferase family 4 protein [Actinomycetota bacterium]
MRPLRVLFINENIGGHATVHLNLRSALAHRGDIEPTFLDLPAPTGLARLAGAAIPGLARLDVDLQPLRAQLARSLGLARRLGATLDGVDAVHLYTHNAGLLSAATWRRVPTVVSLDTTNVQNGYRLPGRTPTALTPLTVSATKPFERRVYQAATLVVANSNWAADSLRRDYAVDGDKLRVQPFGIAAPDFGPGAAPGTRATERPRAVFVGRSLARKGGLQLLRVHQQHLAPRVDLTLVTAEQPAVGPGVELRTDLVPGDRRLWDVLRSAAMFVFPSEIDMAPNAVLEAMMAGLPVVARPVGAIPEMVEHGVSGLLIGPGDEDLTAAVTALLDDPERRRMMAEAARLRAMEYYDARATTDALIGLLGEAVGRHRTANLGSLAA